MIKTAIKHKLAEICIDELFRGILKNFPIHIGTTITLKEFRKNAANYIGMYIIRVSLDNNKMDKYSIGWEDREKLERAETDINNMSPLHLVGFKDGTDNIDLQYNYNETGQILMSDPYGDERVEEIVLFTISNEPIG